MSDARPDDDGWYEIPLEWETDEESSDWRPVAGAPNWAPVATPDPAAGGLPPGARKRRGTIGWDILLGVDLALIGVSVLLSLMVYFVFVATGEDLTAGSVEPVEQQLNLFIGITVNLFLFGAIPLVWVAGTRVGGWEGVKRYLHLHSPRTAIWGIPLAVGLVLGAFLLVMLLGLFGWVEQTPNSEALMSGMTWPLVFFVSFVAGTSEEILFRGVLQKWTGWVGQGLIFGLFHLPNGVTGFVATALIGLLFGYLVKRGHSLWVVIVAHFTYDVILLSLAMIMPELG